MSHHPVSPVALLAIFIASCASPADQPGNATGQVGQEIIDPGTETPGEWLPNPIGKPLVPTGAVSLRCLADDMSRTVYGTPSGPKTAVSACFPFRCDGATGTCATSCTTTLSCAQGAICRDGHCIPQRFFCDPSRQLTQSSVRDENGDYPAERCGEYACNPFTGMCRHRCDSTDHCNMAAGYECASDNACHKIGTY